MPGYGSLSDSWISRSIIFPDPMLVGDTWTFQISAGQYGGADQFGGTYTAYVTFAAAATKLSAAATLVDNFFVWTIPGSSTSQIAPQPYAYNVAVTDSMGNRVTIESGAAVVAPDISVPGTSVNNRTALQLMLLACDQSLISLLSQTTSMVMFAGQEFHFYDVQKLFTVRDTIVARVADEEEVLQGNRRHRRIITVFRNQ